MHKKPFQHIVGQELIHICSPIVVDEGKPDAHRYAVCLTDDGPRTIEHFYTAGWYAWYCQEMMCAGPEIPRQHTCSPLFPSILPHDDSPKLSISTEAESTRQDCGFDALFYTCIGIWLRLDQITNHQQRQYCKMALISELWTSMTRRIEIIPKIHNSSS